MDDEPLTPEPDVLLHVEARDELVTFYLSQGRAAGQVYATVVKQLINRIYRDHDYLKRKEIEGKPLPYADVLRTDMQAMAWLLVASRQYLPEELRRQEPPFIPPKPRKTKKQTNQALRERAEQRKRQDIRYQQEGKS